MGGPESDYVSVPSLSCPGMGHLNSREALLTPILIQSLKV